MPRRLSVVANENESGYSCTVRKKRYLVEIKKDKRGEPYISFTNGGVPYWMGNIERGRDKKTEMIRVLKRKLGEEYGVEVEIIIARQEKLF